MALEHWFRLSGYLTLGLSCVALVFAEAPFLPDLQICLAPVLSLLLLGWWVEGRWSLPNWGANILGLLIVAGGAFWLLSHRSDDDLVLTKLPFHLAMLPYMGPLLMAALLVKVFRRRDPGHFWHVQVLALTQIGLGCMLEGGPAFGAAMAVYLACALVCLALHYQLAASRVRTEEKKITPHLPLLTPHSSRAGWWLFSFTPRWTLLIAGPALLLFLLTPRRDNWSWEPLNNFRSGISRIGVRGGSDEVDLNHTGRLELDDEIAFQVAAFDAAGQTKVDLPVDQHWRSTVLDWYEHGTWTMLHLAPGNSPLTQQKLPDFGPDQFFLDFTVQPRRAGTLVLADPIRFGPRFTPRLPVISLDDAQQRLFAEQWSTLLPVELNERKREYRYRQVLSARGDASRTAAEQLYPENAIRFLQTLPAQLDADLQSWTIDLLRRLSQQPRYHLPPIVRALLKSNTKTLLVAKEEWEATARALTDYLAHSGEFTYSLEITRQDRSIDPILDFLQNVKTGHCERYAAALASILRSVGIPARIVKGFLGWDSKGDGQYVVRHRHAHAWVEILVPRSSRPVRRGLMFGQQYYYDWLTLDPTPEASGAAAPGASLNNVWEQMRLFCLQSWRSLIVEYNSDEQADMWETLTSGRSLPILMRLGLATLTFAMAFVVWFSLRRLRFAQQTTAVRVGNGSDALYQRLVRILGRYVSLRPAVGQTPREYGESARAVLQARPTLAALAEWPLRVIDLFYRVRFGGSPLREEERQELDRGFDRFTKAMPLFSREPKGSA
jgi:transglutaminase-like putative cysteine protease